MAQLNVSYVQFYQFVKKFLLINLMKIAYLTSLAILINKINKTAIRLPFLATAIERLYPFSFSHIEFHSQQK
jgi:hypothetical protein